MLHPNAPAHDYDDFHVETDMKLQLKLPKSSKWVMCDNLQIKCCPTALREITL